MRRSSQKPFSSVSLSTKHNFGRLCTTGITQTQFSKSVFFSASTQRQYTTSSETTTSKEIPKSHFTAEEWKSFVQKYRSYPTPDELIQKSFPPLPPTAYVRALQTLVNLEYNEVGLQKGLRIFKKLSDAGVTKLPEMYDLLMKLCMPSGNIKVASRIFKECYERFPKNAYYTTDRFVQILANQNDPRIFQLAQAAPQGFMASTYNQLLSYALKHQRFKEIEEIRRAMEDVHIKPNHTTSLILLQAYAQQNRKKDAFQVLKNMEKQGTSLGPKFLAAALRVCDTATEARENVLESCLAKVELKHTTHKYLARAIAETCQKQEDSEEAGKQMVEYLTEKGCQPQFIGHVEEFLQPQLQTEDIEEEKTHKMNE